MAFTIETTTTDRVGGRVVVRSAWMAAEYDAAVLRFQRMAARHAVETGHQIEHGGTSRDDLHAAVCSSCGAAWAIVRTEPRAAPRRGAAR